MIFFKKMWKTDINFLKWLSKKHHMWNNWVYSSKSLNEKEGRRTSIRNVTYKYALQPLTFSHNAKDFKLIHHITEGWGLLLQMK